MCFRQNHFEREPATTIAFLTGHFKRIAFWLWSRMATAIYRRLPVFGRLRGSNAIIESRGRFLLLRRNDGLGLCFPGGLASGAESTLDALRRELMEETGLVLLEAHERFSFESDLILPAITTVFTATVEGTPRASWEGIPLWLTLAEMDQENIFGPHLEIVNYLKAKPENHQLGGRSRA